MLGNLELMAKRLPDDARLRRHLDGAVEGARRGASLTKRMLAFARRQELAFESVDLRGLVGGMADMLARALGSSIAVETRFPVRLRPARVDPNQLETALLNLAVNARDAMPGDGTITMSGREEAWDPGAPPGLAPGRYVVLAVEDDGQGMDEATLARAAEPFFTTKPVGKGTGLGLALAHGLAAQSGGALDIAIAPGRGTRVELWLPVARGPVAPVPRAAPVLVHSEARPCRVLLVDDDALVRAGTAAMLEDIGHEVTQAGSGREALDLLRTAAVDLVVTDQVMPGMSGLEMAALARDLRPGLPIVLASGFAELSEADAARLPRLAKPFTQAALAWAVADALPPADGLGGQQASAATTGRDARSAPAP